MLDNQDTVPMKLEEWQKGDSLDNRARLNQPARAINRLTQGIRPPTQLNRNGDKSGASLKIQQFQLVTNQPDFLECRRFVGGGDVETGIIKIQKPPLLRNSSTSRDGITYTSLGVDYRRADRTPDTEEQVVVPNYVSEDMIYAVFTPGGGTGNPEIEWLDLNVDARAWARKSS